MSYLYEKWLATVRKFKSERALIDISSGNSWTFDDLLRESERTNLALDRIIYPRGAGPEFIFSILQSWRAGSTTCPLEAMRTRRY